MSKSKEKQLEDGLQWHFTIKEKQDRITCVNSFCILFRQRTCQTDMLDSQEINPSRYSTVEVTEIFFLFLTKIPSLHIF